MPAQRPRAAFQPIPPDLDVENLVKFTPNFEYAAKIHCDSIDDCGLESFERLVALNVVFQGKPLVIEGFQDKLDDSLLSEKWLRSHYSAKTENARDLTKKSDLQLTIGHYLKNLPLLTNQLNTSNYGDPERQRIYLKDIDCPRQWHDHLRKVIPPSLFYLNKYPEDFSGPGAKNAMPEDAPKNSSGRQIAKAGDLMSCLPSNMRAENLMCYIGHEGTYTPAHQEMCASLGQNIMVEASDGSIEYGKETKPGSSLWFMTESKDRRVVSEYWISVLGHDIDIEDHFAQINSWKAAPFKTYIVEQRPGDLILVPPLAAHQVWNRGTRTMKVAWNRTTAETLDMALHEALPHARMVCRDEQYKNKAIVFHALEHYSRLLSEVSERDTQHPRIQQVQYDFEYLFNLYTSVLLSECFNTGTSEEMAATPDIEYIPFDSSITCSYCRGNIFNRFLTCPWCVGEEGDNYDICMECYVMGRSCACVSRLKWVEQFRWADLVEKYERWTQQILAFPGAQKEDVQCFSARRQELGKKTLAQVCQEQLQRRPWNDITKFDTKGEGDSNSETNATARKRRKVRKVENFEQLARCHICKSLEPRWKLATCAKCSQNYCYGSLFRAFNMLPHKSMEVEKWECPKCLHICSCAACRRDPEMKPFEPPCMLLGYDTTRVADPRSVDSLVDFRHSNLRWLKKSSNDDIDRMEKHLKEAEETRQSLPEPFLQLEETPLGKDQAADVVRFGDENLTPRYSAGVGDIPVDPALETMNSSILTPPGSLVGREADKVLL